MNKKKILVIEDEKILTEAMQKKLESEGFDVSIAEDGQEGLELAVATKPDLILLDIVLPVKDGISVLKEIHSTDWGSKIPVIILTNLSRASGDGELAEQGVKAYLVKTSWKLDDVVQRVKDELGMP